MWYEERVTTLKKLWLEGLSASQIAKQLGGVTRNAVIGKVHRLGLAGRAQPSAPTRTVYRAPRPPRVVTPRPQPTVAASAQKVLEPVTNKELAMLLETPGSATIHTLGAHMCKWPIGDPAEDSFTFCGRRAGGEGPYCADHARVAYAPPTKRRASGNELARSLRRYI